MKKFACTLITLVLGLCYTNGAWAWEYKLAANSRVAVSDVRVVNGRTIFSVPGANRNEVLIRANTFERKAFEASCTPNKGHSCFITGTAKYFNVLVEGRSGSVIRLGDAR